nr:plxy59 [Calliteara abietis nucleopolyhedrovirus]
MNYLIDANFNEQLPARAKRLYKTVFSKYHKLNGGDEEIALHLARKAVEKKYVKINERWYPKAAAELIVRHDMDKDLELSESDDDDDNDINSKANKRVKRNNNTKLIANDNRLNRHNNFKTATFNYKTPNFNDDDNENDDDDDDENEDDGYVNGTLKRNYGTTGKFPYQSRRNSLNLYNRRRRKLAKTAKTMHGDSSDSSVTERDDHSRDEDDEDDTNF